jgi:uncharacterized protein YkwD
MRIEALKLPFTLPLLAALLSAMSGAAWGQAAAGHNLPPPCQAQQEFSRKAEAIIAERVNAARALAMPGAPVLAPDEQLSRIAQLRSCELARAGTLSHLDDKGHFESADIVFSVFGLYGSVAENLMQMTAAAGQRLAGAPEFAKEAVDLWMKSPEHRPHILDPRFDISGIGVAMVGGNAVATQVFHGPSRDAPPRAASTMRRTANARPE